MPDDVTPLDDSQLLVLSTMAYRLDRAGDIQPGDTLRSIANAMRDAVLERMTATGHEASDNLSQQMSYRDWLCVLDCAAGVPALADLAVDAFDIDAAGAKKILLADGRGNAYAIFGGTGAGEWMDNVEAAYEAESAQQRRALEWLKAELARHSYAHVIATGHSKGGNKAMYIAVCGDGLIDRAVAFDAQGFSRAFARAHGEDILANTQKITQYSLDNDYVNGLLSCIALHSRRIYVDGSHVVNPVAYHSPFSLFNPYHGASGLVLEIGGPVPQGRFGKAFAGLSQYIQENASDYEYRQVCTCLGAAFENLLVPHVSDADRAARSIEIAQMEGFGMLLEYLSGYMQQSVLGVGVPDIVGLLLPSGRRGNTILDDVRLGALDVASSVLKLLTK